MATKFISNTNKKTFFPRTDSKKGNILFQAQSKINYSKPQKTRPMSRNSILTEVSLPDEGFGTNVPGASSSAAERCLERQEKKQDILNSVRPYNKTTSLAVNKCTLSPSNQSFLPILRHYFHTGHQHIWTHSIEAEQMRPSINSGQDCFSKPTHVCSGHKPIW